MNYTQEPVAFPLVSVIIPAYNAELFVAKTISSVLTQTYENFEILVIDDGSYDQTPEIVRHFAKQDSRVKLLQQPNAGVAAARNLGIQKAQGEFIAPLDADDIWYPQKLEKQVQTLLASSPSVALVYTWWFSIDINDQIIGQYNLKHYLKFHAIEGYVLKPLIYKNFIGNASSPLIRRTCLDNVEYSTRLREQNAQGCEDWDIYLRIAEHYEFRVVPEFLIGYRQYGGSMSCDYSTMARSYYLTMADLQQRHPEIERYIYHWSAGFFYSHLAGNSRHRGNYSEAVRWLYKGLSYDLAILLRTDLYKIIFRFTLEILAKLVNSFLQNYAYPNFPFTKRITHIHLHFFQRVERDRTDASPKLKNPIVVSKRHWLKPYDRLTLWRWVWIQKSKVSLFRNESLTLIKDGSHLDEEY